MPAFATTKHLNLRAYRDSDAAHLIAQDNDWRVIRTGHPTYCVPRASNDATIKAVGEDVARVTMWMIVEVKREYLSLRKWDAEEVELQDKLLGNSADKPDEKDWDKALFAGFAVLHIGMPKNRDGGFGMSLNAQWWGNGFGTEVTEWFVQHGFEQLHLHRFSLEVFANNPAAIRVYEKCGFVKEGRTRKAFWLDGDWVDEIRMGMLDDEYRERKKRLQAASKA